MPGDEAGNDPQPAQSVAEDQGSLALDPTTVESLTLDIPQDDDVHAPAEEADEPHPSEPAQATINHVALQHGGQPLTPFRQGRVRRFEGTPRDDEIEQLRRDSIRRQNMQPTVEDADESDGEQTPSSRRFVAPIQGAADNAVAAASQRLDAQEDRALSAAYQEQLHDGWDPDVEPNSREAVIFARQRLAARQQASPPGPIQGLDMHDVLYADAGGSPLSPTLSTRAGARAHAAAREASLRAGTNEREDTQRPQPPAYEARAPLAPPLAQQRAAATAPPRPLSVASTRAPASQRPPTAASSRMEVDPPRQQLHMHIPAAGQQTSVKAKITDKPIAPARARPQSAADLARMRAFAPNLGASQVSVLASPPGIPYGLDGLQSGGITVNIAERSVLAYADHQGPKAAFVVPGEAMSTSALAATALEATKYFQLMFGGSVRNFRIKVAYAVPANPDLPRWNLFWIIGTSQDVINTLTSAACFKVDDFKFFVIKHDQARSPWIASWGNTTILEEEDALTAYTFSVVRNARVAAVADRIAPFLPEEAQGEPLDYIAGLLRTNGFLIKVAKGGGLEAPVWNFYCLALEDLPEDEALELRKALSKVDIYTTWNGLGTRLKAYRCSFCNGRSHPRGLCPFENLPGWSEGNTVDEEVEHEEADDDDDMDAMPYAPEPAPRPPRGNNNHGRGGRPRYELAPIRGRGAFRASNRR
ncbi:hypothetical protein EXIGLDRAFT_764767 [Exidia glandulosa HHB12029]|uniref:Uncharacterized protein n=1 Tax=Exidia glandulosa HHB12029 TaxID=1314781 RepID=A0A165KWU2_EXIGL|nr:hypothetical protein EXIGLDRAFT_764767 [Exidia glandulosa HHB12029]